MTWVEQTRDVYENFEPRTDSLYFRIGSHGMVSFHGNRCHIKKRLSPEQTSSLISDSSFVRINANCYVNLNKIRSIERDKIFFQTMDHTPIRLNISRRTQQLIRQRLEERKH